MNQQPKWLVGWYGWYGWNAWWNSNNKTTKKKKKRSTWKCRLCGAAQFSNKTIYSILNFIFPFCFVRMGNSFLFPRFLVGNRMQNASSSAHLYLLNGNIFSLTWTTYYQLCSRHIIGKTIVKLFVVQFCTNRYEKCWCVCGWCSPSAHQQMYA